MNCRPARPIIVVEWPDNVDIFDSMEDAALSLEPWWVQEGRGGAFDAEGRLLDLQICENNVRIAVVEQTPEHTSQLESILRSFLATLGNTNAHDPDIPLSTLIEYCAQWKRGRGW